MQSLILVRLLLHHAAQVGGISIAYKEVVELLIAKGADVNAKNDSGWTPLHHATYGGFKEVAELLIENGVDVNSRIKGSGYTPLDLATFDLYTEIADLLRKHGGKTGKELKAEGK